MAERSRAELEALIGGHLNLVEAVARRRFPALAADPDLLAWGRIGLWDAARRWDGARPFPPFACVCIRRRMLRWVRTLRRWDRAPAGAGELPVLPGPSERVDADVALEQRIRAAWPPGSLEGYVLRRLAAGESKAALARRLGQSTWNVTRAARRGWAALEEG